MKTVSNHAELLAALHDAALKLDAASKLLNEASDALLYGESSIPTINYDGSGETDLSGLSIDCANAAERARAAIAKAKDLTVNSKE